MLNNLWLIIAEPLQLITSQANSLVDYITNSKDDTIALPIRFYHCNTEHIASMIVDMLEKLVVHNDRIPLASTGLITRFHSRVPPSISVQAYVFRILKYTQLEPAPLLALLIYIDRACSGKPGFTISSLTVHRFLIAAATISAKAWSDSYCTNTHYARVGGLSVQELNALELELLFMLGWKLFCETDLLQNYYVNLTEQHPNFKWEN